MKFKDRDICSFQAFANGVVLKVNQDSVLDAVDGKDKVAVYLYLDEINALLRAIDEDSPDESAPALPTAFDSYSINSADRQQSLVVMNANAVRNCPIAKRNRAFVFLGMDNLATIKRRLDSELERQEQIKAFDEAFIAATGCKLVLAADSNKRVMQPVNQL